MQRTWLIVMTLVLLAGPVGAATLAPGPADAPEPTDVPTTQSHSPRTYVLGGPGFGLTPSVGDDEVTVGPIWFEIPSTAGDLVNVEIDDASGEEVRAFYAFHATRTPQRGFLLTPVEDKGSGLFCTQAKDLAIPDGAEWLRIELNSPAILPDPGCPPGIATTGTISVQYP